MHRIGDGGDIGKGKAAVRRSDGIIENKYKRQKNKSDHPDQIRSCQKLFLKLDIDFCCLLVLGFRFVHNLDVEWNHADPDMGSDGVKLRGVHQPLKAAPP